MDTRFRDRINKIKPNPDKDFVHLVVNRVANQNEVNLKSGGGPGVISLDSDDDKPNKAKKKPPVSAYQQKSSSPDLTVSELVEKLNAQLKSASNLYKRTTEPGHPLMVEEEV